MSDQFAGWTQLLALAQAHKTKAGLREAINGAGIRILETEPFSGYYRCAAVKDGPLLPVAIWRDGGNLYVTRAGETVALERVWPYAVWTPVPYEWYEAVTERGEKWPDAAADMPAPITDPEGEAAKNAERRAMLDALADGKPPVEDEAVTFRKKIDAAKLVAEKLYKVVNSDEEAAAAQAARSNLNELSGKADKRRDAFNRPHLDYIKANNEVWMPLVQSAKASANAIRVALTTWENVKLAAEQKAAREAAEEAAAAALAAAPPPVVPTADGEVAVTHNQPPVETYTAPLAFSPPPSTSHIKGATGRAARVEMIKVAVVTDQDAAYLHLRAIPEIRDAIQKVAQRLVTAGQTVPGVEVKSERAVA